MIRGTRVVRVSVGSEGYKGKLGDRGQIERVYSNDGEPFGYLVLWATPDFWIQYVAPVRVQSVEAWEKAQNGLPK